MSVSHVQVNNYIVYKITNKVNGKFYYGVTNYWKRRKNQYDKAPKDTKSAMVACIRKYGWDNLSVNFLKENLTREEAYLLESKIVNKDLVKNPLCYNLVEGGFGGSPKGRVGNRKGCEPHNKLIDDDTASEICEAYATGIFTIWDLARGHNLKSRSAIHRVLNCEG